MLVSKPIKVTSTVSSTLRPINHSVFPSLISPVTVKSPVKVFGSVKFPKPKFILVCGISKKSEPLFPLKTAPDKPLELPPCIPKVYSTKSVKVVPPVFVAVLSINHQPKKVAFLSIGFKT